MQNMFYLQDSRSTVGNNVVFWNIDGCGYGTNLDKLETYTLEEAQEYHNNRKSDVPLLKELVDKLSITSVDMQYLPTSTDEDPNDEYVIQHNQNYNGNDILFLAHQGETFNYMDTKVFTMGQIGEVILTLGEYTVFSKSALDKIERRTFQQSNINKRMMCKQVGIKLVKPKRVRPTTGKTRGNCPTCGRLTWDFNPYENAYCIDHCYNPY